MADNSTELAQLRALLNAGATSVVIDGQTVRIDPSAIRRRIRELEADDDNITIPTRPLINTIDLTNV